LDRSILGIPHPNSRGNFPSLFSGKKRKKFKRKVQNQLKLFEKGTDISMWLG